MKDYFLNKWINCNQFTISECLDDIPLGKPNLKFYPVSKIVIKSKKNNQKIVAKKNMVIEKKEIEKKLLSNKKTLILDARPKKRFYGYEKEPRKDVKNGNIPGSLNIPFDKISSNLIKFWYSWFNYDQI